PLHPRGQPRGGRLVPAAAGRPRRRGAHRSLRVRRHLRRGLGDAQPLSAVRQPAGAPRPSHPASTGRRDPPPRGRMAGMTSRPGLLADVPARARDALPFRSLALAWVVTGGVVAGVPGPLGPAHGSWSAASQALVGGVMQGALGIAQAHLAARRLGRRALLAQLLTWNLGCLAVIGGTQRTAPLLVDAGGLALVA